jgi:hypothetical protein
MRHVYLAALIGLLSANLHTTVRGAGTQDSVSLLHGCQAAVNVMDGGTLEEDLQYQEASWCVGYLAGIQNLNAINEQPHFCDPDTGTSSEQTIRIVAKYLQDHPEELHEPAVSSVLRALRAAFPCD